ncbi:MAG: hypothetical protein R2857_13790 [Vampirovibrionales bacterium]
MKNVRVGQFDNETVRVVIETDEPDKIADTPLQAQTPVGLHQGPKLRLKPNTLSQASEGY